mmetsp:Transcript_95307/g.269711  ORF Transcript_95307/g.269711 Transcript_95307/m.269711 type:complete len:354 (+) Transcript_95307:1471-2532(+)
MSLECVLLVLFSLCESDFARCALLAALRRLVEGVECPTAQRQPREHRSELVLERLDRVVGLVELVALVIHVLGHTVERRSGHKDRVLCRLHGLKHPLGVRLVGNLGHWNRYLRCVGYLHLRGRHPLCGFLRHPLYRRRHLLLPHLGVDLPLLLGVESRVVRVDALLDLRHGPLGLLQDLFRLGAHPRELLLLRHLELGAELLEVVRRRDADALDHLADDEGGGPLHAPRLLLPPFLLRLVVRRVVRRGLREVEDLPLPVQVAQRPALAGQLLHELLDRGDHRRRQRRDRVGSRAHCELECLVDGPVPRHLPAAERGQAGAPIHVVGPHLVATNLGPEPPPAEGHPVALVPIVN